MRTWRIVGALWSSVALVGCADDPAVLADAVAATETITTSSTTTSTAAVPTSTSSTTPATTASTTTTPPPASGGTRDAPFSYGTAAAVQFDSFGDADGSVWNATIGPPDGTLFAGFTVEMTLVEAGKEPLAPAFNMSWEILGGVSSAVHDEGGFDGCGVSPNDFDGFSEVFVGGTLAGVVCIPIPVEDLVDPRTQVAIHHSADSRTIFAP